MGLVTVTSIIERLHANIGPLFRETEGRTRAKQDAVKAPHERPMGCTDVVSAVTLMFRYRVTQFGRLLPIDVNRGPTQRENVSPKFKASAQTMDSLWDAQSKSFGTRATCI